ncbi:hypothetical protein MPSEU_000630100 [Mayamaea pseudoterrestris]|nr:hypothetical protein MPSEU_000630100 [Mayamaea pseudoterrestris]
MLVNSISRRYPCLQHVYCYIILLTLSTSAISNAAAASITSSNTGNILVVGSVNSDTFLPVDRLPCQGENIVCRCDPVIDVPGGKGCTQAVAIAKMMRCENDQLAAANVYFIGQFGNDASASMLQETLKDAGVDISLSTHHSDLPSGQGFVLVAKSGQVTAVVSGGANLRGWTSWKDAWETLNDKSSSQQQLSTDHAVIQQLTLTLQNCKYVLLQREVPEYVNQLVATLAKRHGVCVLQDIGGEERPIHMMHLCDYVIPNETELLRLCKSLDHDATSDLDMTSDETIVRLALLLQQHGARNVLVTRGSRGCTLVTEAGDSVIHQPAVRVEHVVDETGAGDCFRAAFCVGLSQGKPLEECLQFASAAGACSVERHGAVPSTPTRNDVMEKWNAHLQALEDRVLKIPRGDGLLNTRGGTLTAANDETSTSRATILTDKSNVDETFPFMIGSRLNSMKDRPELWNGPLTNVRDWVKRQATVRGLTCIDFNYPQHFASWTKEEAKAALLEADLKAGAVCLRFPSKFARGAMNHPERLLRDEATRLILEAAEVAQFLGCNEVVIWSAYDGYDYPFQVDYDEKWSQLVSLFRRCCDSFPGIKFSIEYKPTDENTRFFTVPSTAAAILLMQDVDRLNFGLTLDVGHMLMAGESPGQSIAMVGRAGKGKLFGIQLNDGYTRLAAEDGLMFGSIHPSMALEVMYQLRRIKFDGHLYFDTFPQRTDPVKEAGYNIRRVKEFWKASSMINVEKLKDVAAEHDAIGALELVDDLLRRHR